MIKSLATAVILTLALATTSPAFAKMYHHHMMHHHMMMHHHHMMMHHHHMMHHHM